MYELAYTQKGQVERVNPLRPHVRRNPFHSLIDARRQWKLDRVSKSRGLEHTRGYLNRSKELIDYLAETSSTPYSPEHFNDASLATIYALRFGAMKEIYDIGSRYVDRRKKEDTLSLKKSFTNVRESLVQLDILMHYSGPTVLKHNGSTLLAIFNNDTMNSADWINYSMDAYRFSTDFRGERAQLHKEYKAALITRRAKGSKPIETVLQNVALTSLSQDALTRESSRLRDKGISIPSKALAKAKSALHVSERHRKKAINSLFSETDEEHQNIREKVEEYMYGAQPLREMMLHILTFGQPANLIDLYNKAKDKVNQEGEEQYFYKDLFSMIEQHVILRKYDLGLLTKSDIPLIVKSADENKDQKSPSSLDVYRQYLNVLQKTGDFFIDITAVDWSDIFQPMSMTIDTSGGNNGCKFIFVYQDALGNARDFKLFISQQGLEWNFIDNPTNQDQSIQQAKNAVLITLDMILEKIGERTSFRKTQPIAGSSIDVFSREQKMLDKAQTKRKHRVHIPSPVRNEVQQTEEEREIRCMIHLPTLVEWDDIVIESGMRHDVGRNLYKKLQEYDEKDGSPKKLKFLRGTQQIRLFEYRFGAWRLIVKLMKHSADQTEKENRKNKINFEIIRPVPRNKLNEELDKILAQTI